MITNFEKITSELTEKELSAVPIIRNIFQNYIGKNQAVKSPELCNRITLAVGWRFNDVRLRKVINYLRKNAILPVIGTSQGYYLSYSDEELNREIRSLLERSNSILQSANGLQKLKEKLKKEAEMMPVLNLFSA